MWSGPLAPVAAAQPLRRVGPDSLRVVAPKQTERRPPSAAAPRTAQEEGAPAARDGQRPAPREGGAREAPRGPSREGARPAGPRPGGAAAGGSARPGFGARPGAGAGARPGAAPAAVLDISGRPERVREVDAGVRARAALSDEEEHRAKRGIPGKTPERAAPAKKTAVERPGRQRLTLSNALNEEQKERSLASLRRQRERQKLQALGGAQNERVKIQRVVQLPEAITIQELGNRMAERAVDIIKFLMKEGQMMKINDVIDTDTAELIATEFGHTVKRVSEERRRGRLHRADDAPETRQPRAAGGHHHGPRRPRQDLAARRHPPSRRRRRRGWRHHPAYRRLSGYHGQRRTSPFSIRPATPRLPPCARAAPRSPT